jgi:type IV secretion system protein TrbL
MKYFKYFILVIGFCVPSFAWAMAPVPSLMQQWQTITSAFGAQVVDVGTKLLFSLMALQFTINGFNYLLREKELMSLVKHIFMTLITTTVFFVFIVKSGDWFPRIIDTWNSIGGQAAHTGPLNPGGIVGLGIQIIEVIRSTVAAKAGSSIVDFMRSVGMSFQVIFVEIFILLSFLVLAGQLALAMLKGYLWLCLGPILLGFGGLSYTKDIAINTLKSAISIGVTILSCYVIAGVAENSVDIFNQQIATFTMDNWVGLWNCVGVSALIALAAWQVPKIANDFINGSISGGVGETMAQGAVAAAGAAAMTGGVGNLLASAGKGAVENLAGIANAGGAALNAASDMGKTGLDAAAHASGEVVGHATGILGGSIRSMLDTSRGNFSDNVNDTLGGKVAQSIEASRGGSISSASGAGSSPGPGGTSTNTSMPGSRASGPSGGSNQLDATHASSDMSAPPSGGGGIQGGPMGDASNAALTSTNSSPDPLAEAVYQMAQQMSQKPSVADRIRGVGDYVPSEGQSVSLNANLGQGAHHD